MFPGKIFENFRQKSDLIIFDIRVCNVSILTDPPITAVAHAHRVLQETELIVRMLMNVIWLTRAPNRSLATTLFQVILNFPPKSNHITHFKKFP